MGGGHYIFFSLAGPVGDYTGAHTVFFSQDFFLHIILQKEEPRWSSGKIYAHGSPSSGLKRSILFLGISRGFLCIFCRKDQRSCDGWAAKLIQGEAQLIQGEPQLSRVQRSSEGCSIAQKGAAYSEGAAQFLGCSEALRALRSSDRVQHSSEGCSVAQKGAAQLRGCSVAQIGCGVAHQGAAQLMRVYRSSVRCNVAHQCAAQPSGKIYAPGGPSLGLKGSILFMEIVYFFIFGGAAKLRWGRARSARLACL